MAVYPDDPPVSILAAATLDHDGYAVAALHLNDQLGTHVETQAHMIPGRTIDQEPLERFTGSAAIVDVPCAEISVGHLQPQEALIRSADFLLLRSGYADTHEGIDLDDPHRPFLSLDAVDWIIRAGVSLVGIDCFDFDRGPPYEGHRRFFSAGVLIVEGLVNLHRVGHRVEQVFVVPLKIEGTGGAPCRVLAFIP
jgi:arylformamidase